MTPAGVNDKRLLEREAEVAALDDAIRAAAAGNGSVVIVEGTTGIGKTMLLAETSRRATDSGMRALSGRAAVLERNFGFAVVRQLFEPIVADTDPELRARLLAAAAIAALLVEPHEAAPAEAPANEVGRRNARDRTWVVWQRASELAGRRDSSRALRRPPAAGVTYRSRWNLRCSTACGSQLHSRSVISPPLNR